MTLVEQEELHDLVMKAKTDDAALQAVVDFFHDPDGIGHRYLHGWFNKAYKTSKDATPWWSYPEVQAKLVAGTIEGVARWLPNGGRTFKSYCATYTWRRVGRLLPKLAKMMADYASTATDTAYGDGLLPGEVFEDFGKDSDASAGGPRMDRSGFIFNRLIAEDVAGRDAYFKHLAGQSRDIREDLVDSLLWEQPRELGKKLHGLARLHLVDGIPLAELARRPDSKTKHRETLSLQMTEARKRMTAMAHRRGLMSSKEARAVVEVALTHFARRVGVRIVGYGAEDNEQAMGAA